MRAAAVTVRRPHGRGDRRPEGPILLDCKVNPNIAAPFMGEFAEFESRHQQALATQRSSNCSRRGPNETQRMGTSISASKRCT